MRHQRWPYYVGVAVGSVVIGVLIAVSGYGGTKPPGLVGVPTPTTTSTTEVVTTTSTPPSTTSSTTIRRSTTTTR